MSLFEDVFGPPNPKSAKSANRWIELAQEHFGPLAEEMAALRAREAQAAGAASEGDPAAPNAQPDVTVPEAEADADRSAGPERDESLALQIVRKALYDREPYILIKDSDRGSRR